MKLQMTSHVRQLAHPIGDVAWCVEQLQLSLAVAAVVAAAAVLVVAVDVVVAAVAVALWHPATPGGD